MKKIITALTLLVVLVGCGTSKTYNDEVKRYDELIEKDLAKAVKGLDYDEYEDFHKDVIELDEEIKDYEDKITKDGQISEKELKKYTKYVDKMEDLIKDFKG